MTVFASYHNCCADSWLHARQQLIYTCTGSDNLLDSANQGILGGLFLKQPFRNARFVYAVYKSFTSTAKSVELCALLLRDVNISKGLPKG